MSYKVTFSPLMSGDFRPRDDVPHDGADDRGERRERGERKVSSKSVATPDGPRTDQTQSPLDV